DARILSTGMGSGHARTHTRPLRLLVALFSCSHSAGPHAVTQAYNTVGEQPAHFALAASQSQRKDIGWQQPYCCEESCRFNLAQSRFAVTSPSTLGLTIG